MFHCQVMQASAEKNTTYRLRSRLTMVGPAGPHGEKVL